MTIKGRSDGVPSSDSSGIKEEVRAAVSRRTLNSSSTALVGRHIPAHRVGWRGSMMHYGPKCGTGELICPVGSIAAKMHCSWPLWLLPTAWAFHSLFNDLWLPRQACSETRASHVQSSSPSNLAESLPSSPSAQTDRRPPICITAR